MSKFRERVTEFIGSSWSVRLQTLIKYSLLVLLIVYSLLFLSEVGGIFNSLETNTEIYNEESDKYKKISDFSFDTKGNIVVGYKDGDTYESTSIPVGNLVYLTRGALSGNTYFYPEVSIMVIEFGYESLFEFLLNKHVLSLFVLFLILTSILTYSEKVKRSFIVLGTKSTRRMFLGMTVLLYIDITLSLILL